MARQLVLLDSTGSDWKLDDATRASGRRGIAAARAALAAVAADRRMHADDTHLPAA
ncbi:MAG: hypothetical protein KY443_00930 [Actinobacteria bacterium]|nr:hypothetical protein [Actinomycetota bacterium]